MVVLPAGVIFKFKPAKEMLVTILILTLFITLNLLLIMHRSSQLFMVKPKLRLLMQDQALSAVVTFPEVLHLLCHHFSAQTTNLNQLQRFRPYLNQQVFKRINLLFSHAVVASWQQFLPLQLTRQATLAQKFTMVHGQNTQQRFEIVKFVISHLK